MDVRHRKRAHIKELWPDKLLYGCTMLFVTSLVGFVFAAFVLTFDIQYGRNVPALVREWPGQATLLLSGASAALAFVALRRRQTLWGFLGAGAGVLSLGLYGVGSLFALVAAGFLVASRIEGEEDHLDTAELGAEHWPDKSLAASLLNLMTGLVTLGWGVLVFSDTVEFGGTADATWGLWQIVVGLACLVSAWLLYHQKGRWMGLATGVLGLTAFGAYVLGPLLAAASLVLLKMAWSEQEFDDEPVDDGTVAGA